MYYGYTILTNIIFYLKSFNWSYGQSWDSKLAIKEVVKYYFVVNESYGNICDSVFNKIKNYLN